MSPRIPERIDKPNCDSRDRIHRHRDRSSPLPALSRLSAELKQVSTIQSVASTGGIFAALSDSTRQVVAEAVKKADEAGTIVSYDLNFRSKLWKSDEAISLTKPLVPFIDCLIGNEEDFQKVLGDRWKASTSRRESLIRPRSRTW